jgi:hypothetical protein
LYLHIPQDNKRAAAARLAAAKLFEQMIDRKRQQGESTEDLETSAYTELAGMLPDSGQNVGLFDLDHSEIALSLARIRIRSIHPDFKKIDRLLERVASSLAAQEAKSPDTASAESAPHLAQLNTSVRQLQLISFAGQGRYAEARQLLKNVGAASPKQLLQVLDGLSPLPTSNNQDPFRNLGELQLEVAKRLEERRAELSAADQSRLDECLARAYLASGDSKRGLAIYDKLIAAAPRNRDLLLKYAGLLAKSDSVACRAQAVTIWRRLEALHEPGSREWFPVRLESCKALLTAGETSEARKLLQVTRLVFPRPEDVEMQKRFADLEAAAVGATSR